MKSRSLACGRMRGLVTTAAGFHGFCAAQRNEVHRRLVPMQAEARALRFAASKAKIPSDLLKLAEIQPGLLTASGVSDKAAKHLQETDKRDAVKGLIENFLEPAGADFVEELVFRFLLIRGDTLGGSMRNVGGFIAQKKLTRAILACLKLAGHQCHWLHADTRTWVELSADNADVELSLRGVSWKGSRGPRTILYNIKVPLVGNNVDLSVLKYPFHELNREVLRTPSNYIALGELKGGIDPGGADEHWKTAGSALNRIQKPFAQRKLKPAIFFIAAAIEAKMAVEIWGLLKNGELANAANLTSDDQISSITSWLCSR